MSDHVDTSHPAFAETRANVEARLAKLLNTGGSTHALVFHRELGNVMLDRCGITREAAGLREAIGRIQEIREEFWRDLRVDGTGAELNQSLEYAGRVADFLELAELMCRDALDRDESCGCHLREEHQTDEGEAVRDDDDYANVSVWEHTGEGSEPRLHREKLSFDVLEPVTRSYK
jgi:succinate dehydrogenase / fumarate reductase flavoprotein subunit